MSLLLTVPGPEARDAGLPAGPLLGEWTATFSPCPPWSAICAHFWGRDRKPWGAAPRSQGTGNPIS